MNMKQSLVLIVLFLFTLPTFLSGGEVVVIANASNGVDTISKQDIKEIFLGEKILWKDGSKIKIADNLDKTTAKEFYSIYTGKESSRIKKIWIKKMLRGKMSPPESFKNIDELLDFVSNKKYCIGFISPTKLPNGIKILKVVE